MSESCDVFYYDIAQKVGIDKIAASAGRKLEWHFIGPLQSNKTRPVAENFDWVHSIDRLKVAERITADLARVAGAA